jgi:hypothetical protein
MGCAKCKQKKGKQTNKKVEFDDVSREKTIDITQDGETTNFSVKNEVFDELAKSAPENIFLKLILFVALIVVLPLFSVYLLIFLFVRFFIPKQGNLAITMSWLINGISYPFMKWKKFRSKIKEKSRKREFANTGDYSDDSELLDIEVFTPQDLKDKQEYSGDEELNEIEVVETIQKDNDNNET